MNASIIVSIITVMGSFILVYLGVIKEKSDQKYLVRKEQLTQFYIPFYQMYCAGFLSSNQLSALGIEARGKFLDLMTKNIQYMEPKSQALYQSYYYAFMNLMDAESSEDTSSLHECQQHFDKVFAMLSAQIFSEYKQILKKCHLPVPLI